MSADLGISPNPIRNPRDAIKDETYSEKTRRYRRNILAITFVVIAITWFPDVHLSNSGLFNHIIKEDAQNPEKTFYGLMAILLMYQWISFALYSNVDAIGYCEKLRKATNFSIWKLVSPWSDLKELSRIHASDIIVIFEVRQRMLVFIFWDWALPMLLAIGSLVALMPRILAGST